MQVFSSDVYFTVGTNALLASQKEYYSDLVALVDLGHSFVVIDEHQHRNLNPNTEPVNILLSNNFIRINKNIRLSDLTHFLISNLHTQNVYSTQEPLTHDEIDILRLCVSYSLKQIAIIKGIDGVHKHSLYLIILVFKIEIDEGITLAHRAVIKELTLIIIG